MNVSSSALRMSAVLVSILAMLNISGRVDGLTAPAPGIANRPNDVVKVYPSETEVEFLANNAGDTIDYVNELLDNDVTGEFPNYNEKRSSRFHVFRRGCIPRNGACDHHPNNCCYSSSCRCNLWGSNCRCQRMGLFQKWG